MHVNINSGYAKGCAFSIVLATKHAKTRRDTQLPVACQSAWSGLSSIAIVEPGW